MTRHGLAVLLLGVFVMIGAVVAGIAVAVGGSGASLIFRLIAAPMIFRCG
jgi:hypothetical protein